MNNRQNPSVSEFHDVAPSADSGKIGIEDQYIGRIAPNSPKSEKREANTAWIVAGFVFAILGGYGGIVLGLNYAFLNYNKKIKRLGWAMTVLGTLSQAIWRVALK